MTPPNLLQKLRDLDRTSPDFYNQLTDFLRGNEYQDAAPSLQGEDLAWFVNYLDKVLCDISDPNSAPCRELLDELRRICGVKKVLPNACTLSDSLLGCVYEGTFNGSKVRIRRVRTHFKGDPQDAKEAFHQVTVVWKHLAHPNIAPLLGVTIDPPQLISDRMPGGNLIEYITAYPDADRISLLSDVAEGLRHLHSRNIIHGELEGSNILVDAGGHARITDFGLAVVTQDLDSIRSGSGECGDNARWIAPEILNSRGTYSKGGDVFSFAMVMIEVFTGAVPFSEKSSRAAMSAIVSGERPLRPTHLALTDKLWTLAKKCWDQVADRRPNALRISCGLRGEAPVWKHLIDCPFTTDERVSLITDLFSDRDEIEALKGLGRGDAQSFIGVIDEVLDGLVPWLRRKCLATLCKICGHHALIPRSIQIPLCYNRAEAPRYQGGFAEVWKGEHEGVEVAVKVLKIFVTSDLIKITRRFCKEVITWKALHHQNVLPLLGVTMSDNQFAMVSEWMANGNINEFIKMHRDANRFKLLEDVARGLMYMHSQVMIHGDLKGANIMIDKEGSARLADFGLLTIVSDSTRPATTTPSEGAGTMRWMSPELLDPERFGSKNARPTKESDCYALGMVVLEVLTGRAPFPWCNNLVVMRKIVEGEHPDRPQGPEAVWFTDGLWELLKLCWSSRPKLRPTVEDILERLEQGSLTWEPLSLSTDNDSQGDSNDDLTFTMSHQPSGEVVPRGGNKPSAVSQRYSGGPDTNRGSSQPSPWIPQQLGESPQSEHPLSPALILEPLSPENEWKAMVDLLQFNQNPENINLFSGPPLTALTTLSFSQNLDLQRTAAFAFAEITEKEKQPIERKTLDPVLHLLDSRDIGIQQAACATLKNLATNVNNRPRIVSLGGLGPLTRLLQSPAIGVQHNVAYCISELAKHADNRSKIAGSGALISLIHLTHSRDVRVQRNATDSLLSMSISEHDRQKLVDAGAIPVLVKLLGSLDADVRCCSTSTLCNIALDFKNILPPSYSLLRGTYPTLGANRRKLARTEPRLVQTLVQLIDDSSLTVQRQAALVLRNLAYDANYQLEIVKAGGLNPLLRLLQSPDLSSISAAASCVLNLTFQPANDTPIIEAGFLQPLVTLLAFKDDERTRFYAASALCSLAASTWKNRRTVFNAGVVQSIKELVLEVPVSIQIEMIGCIRNLSLGDELKDRLSEIGISEVLILLTNSPNHEVRRGSNAALQNLRNK